MKKLLSIALIAALLGGVLSADIALAAPPDSSYNRAGSDINQVKETGIRAKDLVNLLKVLRNQGWSITASKNLGDLSVGTTTTLVRTNAEVHYRINGAHYFKASTNDFCTLPATVLLNTQSAYFRFEIDAAGACSVTAGPVVTAVGTDKTIAVVPPRSANKVTLGLLLVQGLAFTGNTTATTADANRIYSNGDPDLIDLLEP